MAVILFDGACNLCDRTVRFVAARDPAGYFQFASLASPAAARLLGVRPAGQRLPDSMVLVENDAVFSRSDAALRVARRLRFPLSLAYPLILLPKFLRDPLYDTIARHRYRWFGRREVCEVDPALRGRFLEDGV